MESPVDLTNLREMTDGDAFLERTLFEEFFYSTNICLTNMEQNCTDGANETWRSSAHALKGTSLNLGAARLSELCRMAQEEHTVEASEKEIMLGTIKSEYALVKTFLETEIEKNGG